MPSFYPNALPRQLPLTPPEFYGTYPNSSAAPLRSSVPESYGQTGNDSQYGMDGPEQYGYGKQPIHQSAVPGMRAPPMKEHEHHVTSSFNVRPLHHESAYGLGPAATLPPLRIPDRSMDTAHTLYQNQRAVRPPIQVQPKEEKASGGVATHLDYELEQMIDFVSEMAQGMYGFLQSTICIADIDMSQSVLPKTTVSASFRNYVQGILNSTRLPSSTILLGLHYLAERMALLSARGVYSSTTGHLYHMLTTALMLASKFLDDNTFQNRSWAEVSKVPVKELNTLELEWLLDIQWNLHIEFADPKGFSAWFQRWNLWQAKQAESTLDSLKLTPLDGNIRRQRSLNKQLPPTPLYTPPYSDFTSDLRDHAQTYWQTPRHADWPAYRSSRDEYSPPSAPTTGPTTPDWYGRIAPGYPVGSGHYIGQIPESQITLPSSMSTTFPSGYGPMGHAPQFNPYSYGGHGLGCMCGYCLPHHDRYSMAHGYRAQTVAG